MVYEDIKNALDEVTKSSNESSSESLAEPIASSPEELLKMLLTIYDIDERIAKLEAGLRYYTTDVSLINLDSFFSLRYGFTAARRHDKFMALLLDTKTLADTLPLHKTGKKIWKDVKNNKLVKWVDEAKSDEELKLRQDLFFGECIQGFNSYAELCRRDTRYGSSFMGLIKAKPEAVEEKLHNDLSHLNNALLFSEQDKASHKNWSKTMLIFRQALLFCLNYNITGKLKG